jgi:hypothetical protein
MLNPSCSFRSHLLSIRINKAKLYSLKLQHHDAPDYKII